jgi:hypothetical protein
MTPLSQLKEVSQEGDYSSFGFSDFFNLFSGIKTIQTFDDKGANPSLARIFHFDGKIKERMARLLRVINTEGAGIYMCITETNGKGRRLSNMVRIRAVFADLDGAPMDKALKFNPSLIVESSPGRYHCFWMTTDTPLNGFSALQKNIARHVDGDPKVHDIPRVMRVPGFYHNKKTPFLSRVCGGSGEVFKYRELVEWFPPEHVPQWSSKRYKLEKGLVASNGFRGNYGVGNGERNAHVLKIIGGMIKRGCTWDYIMSEAFRDGRACEPPLDDKEIQSILNSAQRYV